MVKKVAVKKAVKGKKSGKGKKVAKVKAVILSPDFDVVVSSVTEKRVAACGWAQDVDGSL